jgi:alpha-beta hydrolase superfamily lysophospholipase
MRRREGFFPSRDGTELFYQSWSPDGPTSASRPTFVVTHGIAEHSEAYDRFAWAMAGRGYDVIAWDLRGHGRSPGKRGYVEDFNLFSTDLADFFAFLAVNGRLEAPYFSLGHSMGGLIAIRCAMAGGSAGAAALCLSSPLLGVALAVPPLKDLAARVLGRIWPTITLQNEIRYEDLVHDPKLIAAYGADPLRQDKISPSLYLGMLEAIALANARAADLRGPLFLQIAGREKIVSRPAMEDWFARSGASPKKSALYPESLHEIYNDLERETAFNDLDAYARERLARLEGKT